MNNAAGKIHCSRSRPRHISNLLPKYTRENSPKSYPRAFRKIERNSRWQSRKWLVHANFVPSSLRGGQWMRSKLPGITILQRLITRTSNRSSFVVKSNFCATRTEKIALLANLSSFRLGEWKGTTHVENHRKLLSKILINIWNVRVTKCFKQLITIRAYRLHFF